MELCPSKVYARSTNGLYDRLSYGRYGVLSYFGGSRALDGKGFYRFAFALRLFRKPQYRLTSQKS